MGTFERKISRLQKIRDAYPKTIIAKTGHETTGRYGIKLIDLTRWLMGTGPQGRRMAPQRRSLGAYEA